MSPFEIAGVCHAANREITAIVGDVPVQEPWASVSADMQFSAVKGVEFALANPNATPEAQHEAWCDERRAQGWAYGPTKDVEKKLHPALKPYAELPEGTRRKDAVFRAIVGALR